MFVVDAKGEGEERRGSNRGSRMKVKLQEEAGMIGNCWLDGITQPVIRISADSFTWIFLQHCADAINNPGIG